MTECEPLLPFNTPMNRAPASVRFKSWADARKVIVMWQRRHQNFENGQWIDCTKEDAEKFGPDGAYGGWEIRELPSNTMPTADEIAVIQRLLDLARQVDHALDDAEEVACDGFRSHNIDGQDFDDVVEALDALEDLPDDEPGMTLGPAGKAEWALRRLLDPVIRGRAEHNELIARITATKEPQ